MTDTLSLDTLAGAEAAFKAAAARLEDNTATPDVVSRVEKIIVKATRQHAGWGKLTIDALLVLGLYLLRNRYRGMGKGGRPPKTVRADSLPTLAERGVENRRIAWRALRVARISEADWNAYKASGGTSERGLHEFVRDRELRRDEDYSETKTGNVVPFDPDFSEARSRRFTRGGYLGLATTGSEEWYTPSIIFKALGCRFDLDVASPGAEVVWWIPADRHFTIKENGLERDWGDAFVWMNHPYSPEMTPLWTEKFRQHGNGICLVGDRTSVGWWQDLCANADLVLFVNKKINFISPTSGPGNNTLGSTLVAYGERAVQALKNAAAAGLGRLFEPRQSVPISSQPPGLRDADLNAYMTAPPIAEYLVAVMKAKIAEEGIPADDLWWLECCAGSGNILQHMPPDRRRGIDINPLALNIRRADFLRYELDQTVSWVVLTNPQFSDDGPRRIFNRAGAQGVQAIGLVLPAYLRRDKAQWVNRLDPFYWCIHDELLPKDSFLRNGKPHDVPARFQIWARRHARREPVVERTEHPDLIWVPRSRSNEATIWLCRRGPDIGDIIEAISTTKPPEDHYGIRCSVEAVTILRSIRWRAVLDPLPVGHPPNMSRADIVRLYDEATRRALPTQSATDFLPDQPGSSVTPSRSSPPHEEAQQFTNGDAQTDHYYDGSEPRYIHYDDPYHTIGGGVRICKSPQTARFIANVRVPLDFDLAAHLFATFGPENDR